jgi:transcriptional regulator with XRE-family HTH domain
MKANTTLHRVQVEKQAPAEQVLAKATVRASQLLGLSGADLARTLGLSEPSVSRLVRGDKALNPQSKEGELALLLVRVYRSLDALVGTDDAKRRTWMSTPNEALGGVPLKLVQKAEGLVATVNYLDGMRAPA